MVQSVTLPSEALLRSFFIPDIFHPPLSEKRPYLSFLLLQNILAARSFLETFLANVRPTRPTLLASPNPITIPSLVAKSERTEDEVFVTSDYTINFLQLAIRACQRGNGETSDKQRDARNAWVRLQSRYRGKSPLLSGQA